MSATVILVEVDLVSPAGADVTLRFCDRAMRPFPPTDADRPNLPWDDRLAEPPTFRRALFDDVTTLTPTLGYGAMSLKNGDAGLDDYRGHAWNEVRVWRWTEGTAFSAAVPILKGLCAQPAFAHNTSQPRRVRVDLYDARAELDQPIQANLYGGANNGTTILYDGYPDGLKGRPIPVAIGDLTAAHLPPTQVNAGQYVFQLGEGSLSDSEAIYDGGAAAGFADQGDKSDAVFDATTPAAASYITNLDRGLIKINGSPVLGLTFGVKGDNDPAYIETPGPVIAALLTKGGVAGARIGASITGLASTPVVGVFAADLVNTAELVGWVAKSALTAILPDTAGVYQAVAFAAPKLVADVSIAADQVINVEADDSAPAPIGEIKVGWGRIWTTFSSGELKASVRGTADAERLASEYRWASDVDATVKARFPRAWRTLTIETALRAEADAIALVVSLKALFGLRPDGTPRQAWRVTIDQTDGLAAQLGQTAALAYPPMGLNDNYVLLAEEPMRPRRDQAIWTLWG